MRYIKHLFVRSFYQCAAPARLALLCAGFAALGGCTNETDSAGGSSTADSHIPLALEITASGFTGQPDASPDTRASEQDNYDTWFEETDAIGLFAVRGIGTPAAAIVDGINNSKLTYAPAADASHKPTWQPADAATTLYYYADVTYIAYYPYKDGIAIDPTQSAATILASFSGKTELQPAADQSTPEAYAASDLMTADGTATDTADPSRKLLSLTFTHSYSLLVLKAIDLSPKDFVAPDGAFVYPPKVTAPSSDVDATDAVLNGIKMRKMGDGKFYAIVKPASGDIPIKGSYTTNSALIVYDGSLVAPGLEAGKKHEWTVTATLPYDSNPVERALKPGDFVFHNGSDIEIYPGDGAVDTNGRIPNYTNAIGIVATCNPQRMSATDRSKGWTHAYVMGLENISGSLQWSNVSVDESVIANTSPLIEGAENNMDGYTETEAMLTERASKGDLGNYPAFNTVNTYRNNNAVPAALTGKRSPWFMPSVGQWFDVMVNLCGRSPKTFRNNTNYNWRDETYGTEMWETINKLLSKINKPLTYIAWNSAHYLCSSEQDAGKSWIAGFEEYNIHVVVNGANKNLAEWQRTVRCFFAF